jgi:hypothetical protein
MLDPGFRRDDVTPPGLISLLFRPYSSCAKPLEPLENLGKRWGFRRPAFYRPEYRERFMKCLLDYAALPQIFLVT